jgi:hypothetical protein
LKRATSRKGESGRHAEDPYDIASKTAHLPGHIILVRGFLFFGWMVAFLCSMAVIGLIPTVPIFVIAYMRA